MAYFFVFIFQFIYNISKVLEIKYTYENKVKHLILNSIFINLLSLASFYYSIDLLLKGDLLIIVFFIVGAAVGKWFALTHFENYRAKILNLLKSRDN